MSTDNSPQDGGTPQQPETGAQGNGQQQQQQQAPSFEAWLAAQTEDVKGLITSHTAGLKSALDAERDARKKLEKELRTAAGKLQEGDTTRQELEKAANDLAALTVRADFYEKAHAAGVTNLSLAYIAASQGGLIDEKGKADLDGLKAAYPELFASRQPPAGNAGNGRAGGAQAPADMNRIIRQAAGRR